MIVSKEVYKVNIDASQPDSLLELNLKAAQKKAEDILGYSLEESNIAKTFFYNGSEIINLGNYFINTINSVKINGAATEDYSVKDYYLVFEDYSPLCPGDEIEVVMNVGCTSDEALVEGNCPAEIKLAIMYIAQSLLKNKGSGGYATQTNFGQGNIVIDTTRYKQFYDLLSGYKVFKL